MSQALMQSKFSSLFMRALLLINLFALTSNSAAADDAEKNKIITLLECQAPSYVVYLSLRKSAAKESLLMTLAHYENDRLTFFHEEEVNRRPDVAIGRTSRFVGTEYSLVIDYNATPVNSEKRKATLELTESGKLVSRMTCLPIRQ